MAWQIRRLLLPVWLSLSISLAAVGQTNNIMSGDMKELTEQERRVIEQGATERPFSGKYFDFSDDGVYRCKRCGAELYRSSDKFDAGCGWPSFDDSVEGAVTRRTDRDGRRVEILCARCDAHLGHVFKGEGFTPKNVRHCVNSISLDFVPAQVAADNTRSEVAIFAGGCFWGVEYLLKKVDGVQSVMPGYTGGVVPDPTYRQVSSGRTGHAEAVKVVFDPSKVTFEQLAMLFFEIHDPTQLNRQGPDVGRQYRSEVFYTSPQQRDVTLALIARLRSRGYDVQTEVSPATKFYPAEEYHKNYYGKNNSTPYCHSRVRRF